MLPELLAWAVQALEAQMGAAFDEHEAKLGQQQEDLARQSQKGIATLQVQCPALASAAAHHPPVLCCTAQQWHLAPSIFTLPPI